MEDSLKRDALLKEAIEQELGYERTQSMLRKSGLPVLYARCRRDSIIIWGLIHKERIDVINNICLAYKCRAIVH